MTKALSLVLTALFLGVILSAHALATPQLRVLFLGDNDIHKPAERFKILEPVLKKERIEVVYTDDMRDINAAKLAGFDALAIYANITEIAPAAEAALLDFVEGGGGLVVIHCASYCFHN
jgi:type 1 glutamine amidotransferase